MQTSARLVPPGRKGLKTVNPAAPTTPGDDDHGGRDKRGLYGISVAAELTGLSSQNLRFYEDQGLLAPQRTAGGTRRYSDADLAVLRRIVELLDAGLNTAGIRRVLDLEAETGRLRDRLTEHGINGPDETP